MDDLRSFPVPGLVLVLIDAARGRVVVGRLTAMSVATVATTEVVAMVEGGAAVLHTRR